VLFLSLACAAADLGPLDVEQPNPHEWVVKSGSQILCDYTFAPGQFKPYVRVLAPLRGENILRDSPFDHKHHHGLMFAIRVNGVNFWEEAQGCGHEKPVGAPAIAVGAGRNGQPRARLRHRIHWLAGPDANLADTQPAALLIEDRTLAVAITESTGEVALRWHSRFEVGPKATAVELTGSNYNGLGIRFLQALDPLASHLIGGSAPDLRGTKQSVSPAPWGAVMFNAPGKPETVALFGAPRNPGGEAHYFSMMRPFSYLAATQGLDQKPLHFKRGEKFAFDYLVAVYPEIKPADFLSRRSAEWIAQSEPRKP
jgi:hypothetical protein